MISDKEKLLNAVCEHILNRLPKEEALLCAEFTKAFFATFLAMTFTLGQRKISMVLPLIFGH